MIRMICKRQRSSERSSEGCSMSSSSNCFPPGRAALCTSVGEGGCSGSLAFGLGRRTLHMLDRFLCLRSRCYQILLDSALFYPPWWLVEGWLCVHYGSCVVSWKMLMHSTSNRLLLHREGMSNGRDRIGPR